MWLLPTKGRQDWCQQVLDACYETGMTSQGLVYNAGEPYEGLKIPSNWRLVIGDHNLQTSMNWVFEEWPHESCYGMISDDTVPETEGWCEIMEGEAGDWNLVDTHDGWLANNATTWAYAITGAYCWGGELLRANGWWTLPGTERACGDDVWNQIMCYRMMARRKHLSNVMFRHYHYLNDMRKSDPTDAGNHHPQVMKDRDVMTRWELDNGPNVSVQKIVEAMEKAGEDPWAA